MREKAEKRGGKQNTSEELLAELLELKERLREAEDTLDAIRGGEVDALVVSGPEGERVFTLKGANHAYRIFVESINEGAATLAADGSVLYCNDRFAKMLEQPLERVMGERVFSFLAPDTQSRLEELLGEGLQGSARGDVDLRARDGAPLLPVQASCQALYLDSLPTVCLLLTDMSERKRHETALREAFESLKSSEAKLREQAAELDRKNVTMRELIGQITWEKGRLREDVAANIRDSVLPILEKFRTEESFAPHVKAIRRFLEDLTSPYSREMARIGAKLTMREMDICRMIKGGLTSKEIAESLNVSVQTVDKHRKNIRKKLGIENKAVDLGSFLNTL
jgi:PAS domain S-box-containing protein